MIKLQELLGIENERFGEYNIALNSPKPDDVGVMQNPIDYYISDTRHLLEYIGWHKDIGRGIFRTLDREKTLQFVQFRDRETWLFVGEYSHTDPVLTTDGRGYSYPEMLNDEFSDYVGRLVVHYKKHPGDAQTRIRPEGSRTSKQITGFPAFSVIEILAEKYQGDEFPGYYNIRESYASLATIVHNKKNDWMTTLANVKGVYVITDRSNGKLYVGSAYGKEMIWSRWAEYVRTGHGGDVELKKLPFSHIQSNFQYSLLEIFEPNVDDKTVLAREAFWKEVLDSRNHGYNRN